MALKIATWNINSVRLRIDLLARLTKDYQPDILCLQEIKCHNDVFPEAAIKQLGYSHIAVNGQKGYHGLAVLSRHPMTLDEKRDLDGSGEARHLSVNIMPNGSKSAPITVHNFYVPAGGDIPNTEKNPKFKQKLAYLDLMTKWFGAQKSTQKDKNTVLLGDLNVAPLETDVWSHKQMLKIVSHTPIEVEKLEAVRAAAKFDDVMRKFVPDDEKLFTWWSYRAKDWRASNRGRRLDHIWSSPAMTKRAKKMTVADDVRGWERPSDHAPVFIEFEV